MRNRSSTRGSVDTPLACSLPNRNAVPASSPGLPLRLPWVKSFMDPQPQGGCPVLDSLRKWRNRFAVDYFFIHDPRVAKRQPWAEGRNRVAVKSLLSKTLHRGRKKIEITPQLLLTTAFCLPFPSANEMNNLNAIAFFQNGIRPFISTHDLMIEFHGNPLRRE